MTRHRAAAIAAIAILIPALGGCSVTNPDPADASKASAALNTTFTTLMPVMLETLDPGAELGIKRVREETCLSPEDKNPQTRTSWMGWAEGAVTDPAAANKALDALDTQLLADGWEKKNETVDPQKESGDIRRLYFNKDELGLSAGLYRTTAQETLDIKLTSPCTDQPANHLMQRSELDPEYGMGSQHYEHGE